MKIMKHLIHTFVDCPAVSRRVANTPMGSRVCNIFRCVENTVAAVAFVVCIVCADWLLRDPRPRRSSAARIMNSLNSLVMKCECHLELGLPYRWKGNIVLNTGTFLLIHHNIFDSKQFESLTLMLLFHII